MSIPRESDNSQINIILPKSGILCREEFADYILCKPKLMPLKSITLEKLEKMQTDAEQKLKEAQEALDAQESKELQESQNVEETQEVQETEETQEEEESETQ